VSRRSVGIGVLVGSLLLAGCGGGTSPEDYAAAICNSGADWVDALQAQADQLQSQVEGATPEEAKQQLVDFLDGTIDETDELLNEIEEAGDPDVDNGEAFAADVEDKFQEARDALTNARDQVQALSTSDTETFSQKASELGSLLGQVLSNFEPPRNEEMEQAFEDVAACQDLAG
jgi:hypothetical protein